jgi:hypothetical protein
MCTRDVEMNALDKEVLTAVVITMGENMTTLCTVFVNHNEDSNVTNTIQTCDIFDALIFTVMSNEGKQLSNIAQQLMSGTINDNNMNENNKDLKELIASNMGIDIKQATPTIIQQLDLTVTEESDEMTDPRNITCECQICTNLLLFRQQWIDGWQPTEPWQHILLNAFPH